jgi:hypothetical protein
MSKRNQNLPTNPGPLFEWVKKAQALSNQSSSPPSGSLDIDSELRAAVTADIKASPLSRYQIAARMSELAGLEITETMLYSWTAESKDKHRFPCQFLPAFVVTTGGRRAFECLSRRSGLFALPGPEALRAEIHRLDEQIKGLQEEKSKRKLFLKEIDVEKRR